TGLGFTVLGFLWVSTASVATPYLELAGQMILLGGGLGLTTAPATEAIMGVVPKEKAGIGSAMNDATREVGGTLGVAVIGSVFAPLYAARLALPAGLPAQAAQAAKQSVGSAFVAAQQLAHAGLGPAAAQLKAAASSAFFDGFAAGCLVAAGVAALGAIAAAVLLPAQPLPPPAPQATHTPADPPAPLSPPRPRPPPSKPRRPAPPPPPPPHPPSTHAMTTHHWTAPPATDLFAPVRRNAT